MKRMQTEAVAPVNWKASQALGMKLALKSITERRPILMITNCLLIQVGRQASSAERSSQTKRLLPNQSQNSK